MTAASVPAALAGFCLLLCLLGVVGLVMSRAQARDRRVGERLRGVTNANSRQIPVPIRPIARAAVVRKISPLGRAALLFGYNRVQARHHPVPAPIVLLLALGVSWAIYGMARGVLGVYALPVIPVGVVVLARGAFSTMTERRTRQLLSQFPEALAMIVRGVRVGMPVGEAMRLVAREAQQPTAAEFEVIANEVVIGTHLDEAIKALAERTGISDYQFFATALSLQQQTGGGLTETLEGLADVIRKRLALRARGLAMASEARSSAVALASLPFISFGGMFLLNRPYISIMYTTPLGMKMLGIGAASLLVGVLVMRQIIRKSLA